MRQGVSSAVLSSKQIYNLEILLTPRLYEVSISFSSMLPPTFSLLLTGTVQLYHC